MTTTLYQSQWTYLNRLRQCRSVDALGALIRTVEFPDRLTPETIATTAQALVHHHPPPPSSLIALIRRWSLLAIAAHPIAPKTASKFLQASVLFNDDHDIIRSLVRRFIVGIDSCSVGAVVGGAVALSSRHLADVIPFQRSIWDRIVARVNGLTLSLNELTKVAGAYARVDLAINHQAVVDDAFKPIVGRLQDGDDDEGVSLGRRAELAWALGKVGMMPKRWAETVLVPKLIDEMNSMSPVMMSQFLLAMAHAAICPSELITALETRLQRDSSYLSILPSSYSSQILSNMSWSLAVARRPRLLPVLWSTMTAAGSTDNVVELSQLHQSFEWAGRFRPAIVVGHDDLRRRAREAFFASRSITNPNSDLLLSVRAAAESLWSPGPVDAEVQCDRTGYWLDLVRRDVAQIIEVNGPQHYCRLSSRLRGASLLKASILRQSGWDLLTVPYFEWTFGGANRDAQAHYLRVKALGR